MSPRSVTRNATAALSLLLTLGVGVGPAAAGDWDLDAAIEAELRIFPEAPQFPDQDDVTLSPSVAVAPEARYRWNDGQDRLTFVGFGRLDAHDRHRTHADVREANWLHIGDGWDVVVGVARTFWGVAEARHLVDIINQTDLVEDIDGETKLGQPMINLNVVSDLGAFSVYLMPVLRARTFPEDDARLRGVLPIDVDDPVFESDHEELHPDVAARWSRSFGAFDIGLSAFRGTSREPRFLPDLSEPSRPVLLPAYDIIDQESLDLQYTRGPWLWKLEAMTRGGQGHRFFAAIGGFEHTFFGVFESDADVGVLAEAMYDGRNDDITVAPPVFEDNDVFLGTRIALNDVGGTSVLAGTIIDVKTGAMVVSLEGERRIGTNWKAELTARFFAAVPDDDFILRGIRDDGFVSVNLTRFF